jgi:hypothetical protein
MSEHAAPSSDAVHPAGNPLIIRLLIVAIVVLAAAMAILGTTIAVKLDQPPTSGFAAPVPTDGGVGHTNGIAPGTGALAPVATPTPGRTPTVGPTPSPTASATRTPTPFAAAARRPTPQPSSTPTPKPSSAKPSPAPSPVTTPVITSSRSSLTGNGIRIKMSVTASAASTLIVSVGGNVAVTTTVGGSGEVRFSLAPTSAEIVQNDTVTITSTRGSSTASTSTTLSALITTQTSQE